MISLQTVHALFVLQMSQPPFSCFLHFMLQSLWKFWLFIYENLKMYHYKETFNYVLKGFEFPFFIREVYECFFLQRQAKHFPNSLLMIRGKDWKKPVFPFNYLIHIQHLQFSLNLAFPFTVGPKNALDIIFIFVTEVRLSSVLWQSI